MTESKALRPAAGTAETKKAPGASGTRNAVFLPCTSGLPETSPGTRPPQDGSQPGNAEELTAWAEEPGMQPEDLDDLVHDAFSRQVSQTDNGGLGSQVRFLAGCYGAGRARSLLSDLQPGTARPASAAGTALPPAGG